MNVIGSILVIGFFVLMFFMFKAQDERNEEIGIKEYTTNGLVTMPNSWFKWVMLVCILLILFGLLSQA